MHPLCLKQQTQLLTTNYLLLILIYDEAQSNKCMFWVLLVSPWMNLIPSFVIRVGKFHYFYTTSFSFFFLGGEECSTLNFSMNLPICWGHFCLPNKTYHYQKWTQESLPNKFLIQVKTKLLHDLVLQKIGGMCKSIYLKSTDYILKTITIWFCKT